MALVGLLIARFVLGIIVRSVNENKALGRRVYDMKAWWNPGK
jgi:hypothetical protein